MWLPTLDTIDPNNLSNLIQGFGQATEESPPTKKISLNKNLTKARIFFQSKRMPRAVVD